MLKMTAISKSFFGVKVLDNVDFCVSDGEVHALLGENGAGKSTLMNILAGVYSRDSGKIEFDGTEFERTSVLSSEHAGIAFVHQELNVFNDLSVYENIFLGKEYRTKLGYLDKKAMIVKTRELFDELGVDIDPEEMVYELQTSTKQLLEIAKAFFANAKLFILDEPTTALSNEEIDHLFSIIRRLKETGKSFIFISHKMNEIFNIADNYTVLRNGKFIQTGKISEITPTEVTKLMVGSSFSDKDIYETRMTGDTIVEIKNLSAKGFHDISLEIKKGEIIGLTGLVGAGTSQLLQAMFGVIPIESGTIAVNGKIIDKNTIHKSMKSKIAMIPANRKENSIIPDFSLLANNYISEHTLSGKRQIIKQKAEIKKYEQLREKLNIKANGYSDLITSLSGGNQQKVIIARWLNTDADILIMDNPTQGIDVGAKAEIYKLILELSKAGKTIIINTLEIPEIQKIADRCLVFYHGVIVKELQRNEISEEQVMLYATNAIQTQ